jgi:hypothetical protein
MPFKRRFHGIGRHGGRYPHPAELPPIRSCQFLYNTFLHQSPEPPPGSLRSKYNRGELKADGILLPIFIFFHFSKVLCSTEFQSKKKSGSANPPPASSAPSGRLVLFHRLKGLNRLMEHFLQGMQVIQKSFPRPESVA